MVNNSLGNAYNNTLQECQVFSMWPVRRLYNTRQFVASSVERTGSESAVGRREPGEDIIIEKEHKK